MKTKEEIKEYHRQYRSKNKEKILEYYNKYRQDHPDRVRKYAGRSYANRKRKSLLKSYSLAKNGNYAALDMLKRGKSIIDVAIYFNIPVSRVTEIRNKFVLEGEK